MKTKTDRRDQRTDSSIIYQERVGVPDTTNYLVPTRSEILSVAAAAHNWLHHHDYPRPQNVHRPH